MVRRLLDCESRMISICGKMKEMDEECRKVEKSIEINRKPFEEELRMAAQDFRNTEQEMTEYFKGIMTERDHRKDDTIDTFSILSAMRNSKTEELQSFLYEGYPEFSEINVRKALLKQLLFLCDCGSINAPLVITMACMEGMADEVEYNRHQVCFDDPQSYAELAVRRGNPIAERYYDEMTGSDREIEEALSRHEEDAFIYAGLAMRTVIIMKKRFRYKEAVKYAGLFERIADNCYIKNIAEMSVKRMKMLKKLLKYAVIILVLIRVLKHIFFSFGIPFLVCAILFLLTLFRNGKGELKKWLEL